jgi:hypothetical protein
LNAKKETGNNSFDLHDRCPFSAAAKNVEKENIFCTFLVVAAVMLSSPLSTKSDIVLIRFSYSRNNCFLV